MASNIEIPQLISKKLIKPSSSTPPNLRQYKLSLLDQQGTSQYLVVAFVYPNNAQNQEKCSSLFLEKSLSKILTSYYPLAGRLVDNVEIDCNDKGAIFIEAQVNFPMSEILEQLPQHVHNVVFPKGLPWKSITQVQEEDRSLLVAQLTHFKCGAKSLGVCMSHKIGDSISLFNFIKDWAALNHDDACSEPCPKFDVPSFFPPIEDPSIQLPVDGLLVPSHGSNITRYYTFRGSKISELKSRAIAETGLDNPTRVEVVTAFLFNCAFKAVADANANANANANATFDKSSSSFLQIANLRPFMDPPLSPNSFGNIIHLYSFDLPTSTKDENEVSFATFFSQHRRSKIQFHEKFKGISVKELHMEILALAEMMRMMSRADTTNKENINDSYVCSSLCRSKLNDIDFGWGNPEMVSLAPGIHKNAIILMDDKNGDGIEAMITLSEEVMPLFEKDPELLKFASSSSNV